MLDSIRIVLIGTTHSGNIGAAARAMKTMGLSRLVLLSPKAEIDDVAISRASGAVEILDKALVCDSLDEALAGCVLVAGSSARLRSRRWPLQTPRETASSLTQATAQGEVALLFGRERTGLTNEELDRCHFLAHIPANEDYSSLNIAAAVQVFAYELRMAYLDQPRLEQALEVGEDVADVSQVEGFYQHLEQTLQQIYFLRDNDNGHLMRRLRRLFNRVQLSKNEVNILRGILSAVSGRKMPKN